MSLIKRSVVLYKDQTKGVFTIIRLGETVGAKVVINEPIKKPMWIGIKVGDEVQQNYEIVKQVTELSLQCSLCFNDSIGVIILDDSGNIYAYGGVREKVSLSLIKQAAENALISSASAPLPIPEETITLQAKQEIVEIAQTEPIVTIAANPPDAEETATPQTEQIIEVVEDIFEPVEIKSEPVVAVSQPQTQSVLAEDLDLEPIAEENIVAVAPTEVLPENEQQEPEVEIIDAEPIDEIQPQAQPVFVVQESKTEPIASNPMDGQFMNAQPNPTHARPPTEESEEDFKRNRPPKGSPTGNRTQSMQENNKTKITEQPQWVPESEKKGTNNPFNIPKAKNFYQVIRGRLEEIMTINPKEADLEKIIPDSEWVKVRYDGEEYYVVGRLYENNIVTYIGYGVPGVENVLPPKEAEELCDFLPLPKRNGAGYWLMFQKADDGTISKDM